MKELTRFELAAVKRLAANTKTLRNKIEKLDAKIGELNNQKAEIVREIEMWELPIVGKYGFTVNEILDGSYLKDVEVSEMEPATDCCDECCNDEDTMNTEYEYNTL